MKFPVYTSLMRSIRILCRWTSTLVLVTLYFGLFTAPAAAGGASSSARQISFYGDIGNIINSRNPLLVRPSTLLLAEDGSVALVHLRWSGWGTSVARATGVWNASNCTPSCATGKLTTSPARLMLSSLTLVGSHWVYRCFRISPPHPRLDIEDHGCIRRQGASYSYVPAANR